jgi:hypothetical protein
MESDSPRKTYYSVPPEHQIPHVHKISSEEFYVKYYQPKKPVILTGMMDDWPAVRKWTKEFLKEKIGNYTHTFWYGTENIKMKVSEYIDTADEYQQRFLKKDKDRQADSQRKAFPVLPITTDEKIPYMRHFGPLSSKSPELEKDIKPQCVFPDPEEIYIRNFVFIGVPGTKTNIHYDDSDNFMSMIFGQKMITLLPPGKETELNLTQDEKRQLSNFEALPFPDPEDLILDLNDSTKTTMMHKHPVFSSAKELYYSPVNQGEIVFFPAKWYHYIHNIELSVSLTTQTVPKTDEVSQ